MKIHRPFLLALIAATLVLGSSALPLQAAVVITSGGSLGTPLIPGFIDIEGDGFADIEFVTFGPGLTQSFVDANGAFGLAGNIGGAPGTGAAWVRATSTLVTTDDVGRDEIIADYRGRLLNTDDNWSKVHFTSGDGWVQWSIGATPNIITPLQFIREDPGQDLSAESAEAVPEPSTLGFSVVFLSLGVLFRRRSQRNA